MPRTLRYNIVDVFTDTPLTGNPLAVFTDAKGLSDDAMQNIAREMNLSETVFFFPPSGDGHAKVRIFTPGRELPFAGHPVLGSAWVLAGPMEMNEIRLETGAGLITLRLDRQGDRLHLAHMTQPLPSFSPYEQEAKLRQALGLTELSSSQLSSVHATNGPHHLLVEASSRSELDQLRPNFSAIADLTDAGVLVYAQEEATCFARYFAPAFGINEDPATGSAAGPLGAHLVLHARHPSEERLTVRQGETMKRPSILLVRASAKGAELQSVQVGGAAVVIARGEMRL